MTKQKQSRFSGGILLTALLCICGIVFAISRIRPEPAAESSFAESSFAAETTTPPKTESTCAETTAAAPDESWMLTLVNSTHPLSGDDQNSIELVTLSNGTDVDARIYPALQEMFDAMRDEGIYPMVREGYRTHKDQIDILETRIKEYRAQGYAEHEAERLARQYVAKPGTSEHELGLAVDINAAANGGSTPDAVYNWLAQNAYRYGFIQRYPEGKSDVTGISYEPWHYRYVGCDAAAEIFSAQITLEEYLGAA